MEWKGRRRGEKRESDKSSVAIPLKVAGYAPIPGMTWLPGNIPNWRPAVNYFYGFLSFFLTGVTSLVADAKSTSLNFRNPAGFDKESFLEKNIHLALVAAEVEAQAAARVIDQGEGLGITPGA